MCFQPPMPHLQSPSLLTAPEPTLAALQQQALGEALTTHLSQIPLLSALADAQGLTADIALDQAPALFFPYTAYKAYDPDWLFRHRFADITRWMQNFSTVDLSGGEDLHHGSIDAWIEWLRAEKGLDVLISSGTMGAASLVPLGADELSARHSRIRLLHADWCEQHGLPPEAYAPEGLIWPSSGRGNSGMSKFPMGFRDSGDLADADIVTLYDQDLGVDYELYVALAHKQMQQGEQEMPAPSAYIEGKLAEAERRRAQLANDLDAMLDRIEARLSGRRVLLAGGPHSLAPLVRRALERGIAGHFAPHSRCNTAGGLKGHAAPVELEADLQRFTGSDLHIAAYGMSELGSSFTACPAGRYHMPPWVLVWALDPANGWQPLPREGRQEGRGAFLDLSAQGFWGGVVSGDHIEVNYEPCACGRTSPSMGAVIKRVDDATDDLSFTPAGRKGAEVFQLVLAPQPIGTA